MLPYWLLFLTTALAAMGDPYLRQSVFTWGSRQSNRFAWWGVYLALALMIGGRFQVGGDWFNYIHNLFLLRDLSLRESLENGDPGFQLFSWLVLQMGMGEVALNTIVAALFTVGLVSFCKAMPQPALALAVAIPYLVVVVAMGYTRQSIALAFAMLGLLALQKGRLSWFLFWVLIGATFHKSAVVLLPIAALAAAKNRIMSAVWVACVAAVGYVVLLQDSVDELVAGYVEAEYQSSGAFIRLAMNALPAAMLLRWRYHFFPDKRERMLWSWLAIISIVLFALFFVSPSSTALDRMALYLLPLQLAVLSRVPIVFGGATGKMQFYTILVVSYSAAVMFVWLNFGDHAVHWLPYRFYPLEVLLGNV